MAFDPSQINVVPTAEMMGQVVKWLGMLLWLVIVCIIGFFLTKYTKYRIHAEIFEMRGNAIVKVRTTKLKEVIKDNVTRYEVRTLWGLLSRKRREFYYNTSEEYKIPTTKGYKFYLLKMGFNAYNPLRMNVYSNEIGKIEEELKNPFIKSNEKKKLSKQMTELQGYMKGDRQLKESRYTYVPICITTKERYEKKDGSIAEKPIEFEPIPQNLLPVLARSVVETNQMYSTQKWWEPYVFPFSIFALCIIQIVVMGWMFDKVGQVGGACQSAKESILDVAKQRLT